jgi:hypothetical protein
MTWDSERQAGALKATIRLATRFSLSDHLYLLSKDMRTVRRSAKGAKYDSQGQALSNAKRVAPG